MQCQKKKSQLMWKDSQNCGVVKYVGQKKLYIIHGICGYKGKVLGNNTSRWR